MTDSAIHQPVAIDGPVDHPARDSGAELAVGLEFLFQPNELLVAVSQQDLVVRALAVLGYRATEQDRKETLGLSRLTLKGDTGELTAAQLDDVLRSLYAYFAGEYQRWVPTFGKNRIVGRVVGSGELSYGGDGMPVPVAQPAGWPPRRGGRGRGARVIVLDTAAAAASPLGDGWLDRYSDTFTAAGAAAPASGHATFVAGLILSQAPAATVEVRGVLNAAGSATAWEVATAIVAAGADGADVINLSLVCFTADNAPPMAIARAIDRLDPQIVVVAAAGNHADNADRRISGRPAWPAALPGVIAVGACDETGALAPFSQSGAPWIDLLTIGVDVVSSYLNGLVDVTGTQESGAQESGAEKFGPIEFSGFASWSGTSFAAALVTGAVAAGIEPGRVSALTSLASVLRTAGRGPVGEPVVLPVSTL